MIKTREPRKEGQGKRHIEKHEEYKTEPKDNCLPTELNQKCDLSLLPAIQ